MFTSPEHSRRLFAGDFRELQDRFLGDVVELRAQDPLAPLTVLVPNVLCGLSLRRELARSGTSHANIRFYTLTDYARELAEPVLAERGLRMLPEALRGPLMKRVVETAGPLRYFQRMAPRRGFHHALWETIHELRAAGIDAPLRLRGGWKGGELDNKLPDIAALWTALDKLMRAHKLIDRAGLLELACDAISPPRSRGGQGGVVIYGLDDLSAMERRLIALLATQRDSLAYLPFRASDAYIWSEPLYQWYLEQGFEAELLEPEARTERDDALARVQLSIFEDPPPLSPPREQGGGSGEHSFFLISAPSRDTEVEEILREVLFTPLLAGGHGGVRNPNAREIRSAILMRESANYLDLFRQESSRAGITGYVHECRRLGETPSGRALRSLAKLFDGDFRRTEVMEFMLASPLRRPADFPDELPEVPAAEWNHFAMRAQIVAGANAWQDNLRRLSNQLMSELERREWERDDPTGPIQQQRISLTAFARYMDRLFEGVARIRAAQTWQVIGTSVSELFSELVESSGETEIIRRELAHAGLMDALGLKPEAAEFSVFIESLLSQPLDRAGKFEVHEPAVAKIADTLGVVFDDVYLCGLVEKEFPRRVPQDPLLLDDERIQLQRTLNAAGLDVQVPLRSRQRHRERFLFRVALNSARRRLVLSYPRLDPVDGREWLASTFLLRALEAATGEAADYEVLETFVRTSPNARRVPLNRLHGRGSETSVTPFQYDLARLGEALFTKSADHVADLFCADAAFKRGVKAERARYRTPEFTPFDGLIESAALRERLTAHIASLSPARIERFVTCPFQYFMFHLLELEPSVEPQWTRPLGARARGVLMHTILERFYRSEAEAQRWPLTGEAWERLVAVSEDCFAEFEREQVPGLPLIWDIEKEHLRARLQNFFASQFADPSAFQPKHFNVSYGLPEGDLQLSRREPVTVPLANGLALQLRGRINRVDMNPSGLTRLVSYKTGSFDKHRKRDAFISGLEPHVARLAAAALGLDADEFVYYFLALDEARAVPLSHQDSEQNRVGVMQLMEEVAGSIAGGQFFPLPSSRCEWCEAKSACGTGRFTRKWEHDLPQTERLKVLRGEEP